MIRQTRLRAYKKIIIALKGFNLKRYLLLHAPKTDITYVSFGLFSLASTLASMYFLTDRTDNFIVFFYQSILTLSIMFITYPMWPATIKKTALLPMFWVFCVMYILIIVGTYVLLISNFGTIQLITFMANLLVIAILLEWKLAIAAILTGIYLGTQIYIMNCGPIHNE